MLFLGLAITSHSFAATPADSIAVLIQTLRDSEDAALHRDILKGMSDGLKGRRQAPMPAGWNDVSAKLAKSSDPAVRQLNQTLSLTFGSQRALASLRETLLDSAADGAARANALDALLAAKDASLAPTLQRLLGDAPLRAQAVRALANYDDAKTPSLVLAAYPKFNPAEKRDALNTLASRAGFARVLVAALEQKTVPARDLTAEIVRQIRGFGQTEINTKLDTLWGAVRESPADKLKEIERYKKIYIAGYSTPGDARRGRALFNKTCGQCHTLFEVGGKVGPDLTGSSRADLDYILENIVDPNAVIPNEYRASTIEMKDGRSLIGIVKQQDEKAVTIATQNETLALPRNEIASIQQSELSMMPDGLLDPLKDQEVRDLIYYLGRPGQVPLPGKE